MLLNMYFKSNENAKINGCDFRYAVEALCHLIAKKHVFMPIRYMRLLMCFLNMKNNDYTNKLYILNNYFYVRQGRLLNF